MATVKKPREPFSATGFRVVRQDGGNLDSLVKRQDGQCERTASTISKCVAEMINFPRIIKLAATGGDSATHSFLVTGYWLLVTGYWLLVLARNY